MNSTDFQYDLPEEAIAKHPVEPRRAARMVVVGRDRSRTHHTFEDLPELLKAGGADGLWANDTKVLHARILASKPTGGQLEIFLLAPAIGAVESVLAVTRAMEGHGSNAKRWSDGTATAAGVHHELHISRLPDAVRRKPRCGVDVAPRSGDVIDLRRGVGRFGQNATSSIHAEKLRLKTRRITKPCLP